MTEDDLEDLALYIAEAREHLTTIEADLLAIEAAGAQIDEVLVNKVFRAAHSIKGGAGFFGFKKIQELSHKLENILDLMRSRQLVPNPEVVNILLLSFDKLRDLINHYNESNQVDISEYVVALVGLTTSYLPENQKSSVRKMVSIASPSGGATIQIAEFDLERAREREEYVYVVEIDLIHDVQRHGKTPWDVFKDYLACGTILECEFNFEAVGTLEDEIFNQIPLDILFASVIDPSFITGLFEGISPDRIKLVQGPLHPQALLKEVQIETVPVLREKTEPSIPAAAALPTPLPPLPTPAAPQPVISAPAVMNPVVHVDEKTLVEKPPAPVESALTGAPAEETLRVNVSLLENLMNLAGELVLSRNQLQEAIQRGDPRAMRASGQRISLVTSELQEAIMLTRLQPIGNVLNKFPRVVRDMSYKSNKEIQLDIFGKEVELDKTLIEGLNDPLMHMVRNAVDHGIETQEQRLAAGKNPIGRIILRAYHAAGQVVVEVSDDGKGINPHKVAQSAVTKGIIAEEQVRLMSDQEKCMLIFLPGLSTAEQITDISGRGVGMDVVKTNLDRLGGKVEIDSQIGRGTTFRITLPLTLAIIPSLLISEGAERFAIPQINVSELIHVPAAQVKERIEVVGDAEVLVLRGKLIPIVHLDDLLGNDAGPASITGLSVETARPPKGSVRDLNIVIITAGTFEYGLIVEDLHDTIEIVVRSLGRHLKGCQEYAGATVLGDGHVALILDAAGLAAKAGLNAQSGGVHGHEAEKGAAGESMKDLQTLLLFRNAPNEPCAIHLDLVERIERVDPCQVETLGRRRAMQYRGATLPLVMLQDSAQVGTLAVDAEPVVIVLRQEEHAMGLLAAMPVDVVETAAVVDTFTHRQRGIAGSSIIQNQTTLIVDVSELVEASGLHQRKTPLSTTATVAAPAEKSKLPDTAITVLLAEDSDFFRRQVRKYLEDAGYRVLDAEDGQAAWELLQHHRDEVRLVVTDIEMPHMDGLELTRRIKADPALAALPVIALSSLADEADIAAGRAAGVDEYEIKLDREALLRQAREFTETQINT